EHLTALFFLAAREASVDWAIVETGMGGRLEPTNVLEPCPVPLTRLGLEHTHLLGCSRAAIAAEKAAILTPGGWAVVGPQHPDGEAHQVFEALARATGSDLVRSEERCPIRALETPPDGLIARLEFEGRPLELRTRLLGAFQAEN